MSLIECRHAGFAPRPNILCENLGFQASLLQALVQYTYLLLPRVFPLAVSFCFCREVFAFAMRYFVFAMRGFGFAVTVNTTVHVLYTIGGHRFILISQPIKCPLQLDFPLNERSNDKVRASGVLKQFRFKKTGTFHF